MTTKNKNARIGVTSTAAGKPLKTFQLFFLAVVLPIIPTDGDSCTTAHRGHHAKH